MPSPDLHPAAAPRQPSLCQSLRRAVHLRGNGVAVIDGEVRFGWRDFVARVQRLAGAFRAQGLTPGGRVALLALNSHRSLEVFFASIWAGGVIVPLNHRLAPPELERLVADCAPDLLLLGPDFIDLAPALRAARAGPLAVVHVGAGAAPAGMTAYDELISDATPLDDAGCGGDDLALLLYTSGTTGTPKGVMLSHANLVANTANTLAELELGPDCVHLHHGPLFHIASAARLFSVSQAAGTHVFVPRFVADEVIATIAAHGVTHATFVPTMIRAMLDSPALAATDLSCLRYISYGSAPMPEALLDELMRALPRVRFLQSYGMTELSPVVTILGWRDHLPDRRASGVLRSAGRPALLAEVRVVGPDDAPAGVGVIGEVVARGPNVMRGYWNQPALSAEALRGGWMHTGDAGYFDEDGYLYVVDRIKDMIITGGENVYSQEVENMIATHPAVATCAVIGMPDPHWGEAVTAIVMLRPGQTATPADIIAHCRTGLAAFKCPKAVHLRDRPWPLSGANKILKSVLRDELLASASPG